MCSQKYFHFPHRKWKEKLKRGNNNDKKVFSKSLVAPLALAPNFHSYLSHLMMYFIVKNGPVWKIEILYPSGPPKPEIDPQCHDGAPTQKLSLLILVQSNNDH